MDLKKYRVNNIQEALQLIKKDLGPEAVIVSTRKLKESKGTFGLFGKTILEVTAALEESKNSDSKKKSTNTIKNLYPNTNKDDLYKKTENQSYLISNNIKSLIIPVEQNINSIKETLNDLKIKTESKSESLINELKYELNYFREALNNLKSDYISQDETNLNENLMILFQKLKFGGLDEKFSKRIVNEAKNNIKKEDIENFAYVKIFLARMLMKIIKTTNGIEQVSSKQKIISLIGPTGVGKTTTAAKIASEQIMGFKRKVALISVDNFKIASVEQLRLYTKSIKIPLSIVSNKSELDRALTNFSSYDVILIDTGGCSQRDIKQMFELKEMFDERGRLHNILVLSSGTKDEDNNEITKKFGSMPLDSIIFTKLDESSTYGSIFNHVIRFKKPISYLTTGQNVPEDLEVASKERLVDLLLHISDSNV